MLERLLQHRSRSGPGLPSGVSAISSNRKDRTASDGTLTLQMRRFYTSRNRKLHRQVVTEPKCKCYVRPSLRMTRTYSSHAAGTYVDKDSVDRKPALS